MSKATTKRAAKRTAQPKPSAPQIEVLEENTFTLPTEPKKPSIKRREEVFTAKEYKTVRPSGTTFMMQQRGVTVYDEELDSVREICYCPNEPSVYKDDQSERSVRESIIFRDGRLFAPKEKPNLIRFMDLHPDNVKNGGKVFDVIDKKAKAKKDLSGELMKAEAVLLVRDKTFEELLSVALALGINVDRPSEEIKHDLLVQATSNPKRFIDSFDNPEVEMRARVNQASKYNIIKVAADSVRWFDTGRIIVSVPAGRNAVDVFVKYCLTEAGSSVIDEIESQL
tara:strand:- start:854 stop:1699 length:846 start_codon:yes stop_codon:yes gene_type:complete